MDDQLEDVICDIGENSFKITCAYDTLHSDNKGSLDAQILHDC